MTLDEDKNYLLMKIFKTLFHIDEKQFTFLLNETSLIAYIFHFHSTFMTLIFKNLISWV